MVDFNKLKKNLRSEGNDIPKIKCFFAGDTATQFHTIALKGMAIERGYHLEIIEADYNQIEALVFNSHSELYTCGAQYSIFFQSTHKLLEKYSQLTKERQINLAQERLDFIKTICTHLSGRIIYYNYPEIEDGIFGSYANKVLHSFTYQVRKLNYELMNVAQDFPNLYICDIAGLQNKLGRDFMFNPSIYVNTDMVIGLDALPYVASRTMDIIDSIEGRFKKCLILDLDNTIWGGVVGDDGWENIQIGHDLGVGKAYQEFQEWIKKLKERGIILAVCSKNDEYKAKEAFEKNPGMILKITDISVFIANWDNKVDNIHTIQRILNIGYDSMVFLDDNPFERNMVRENIPKITVPELPDDPGEFLEYLYSLNLFETASFSEQDVNRSQQYQVETLRVAASKRFEKESDFLRSLEMTSEVSEFEKYNIPRVAQLSQRSNQFNLRTVRYTEAQVWEVAGNSQKKGFSFTLRDRFGDNGLIAVVVLDKYDDNVLFIENWFMSCRVLKRGMENFIFNTIMKYAVESKFQKVIGEYIPTVKNGIVREMYSDLGFEKKCETKGYCRFEFNVKTFKPRECYINNVKKE